MRMPVVFSPALDALETPTVEGGKLVVADR